MIASQRERAFDRRFYGVVNGIVVDNVDPDKLGRIKVRFPWYDDGTITEWCRVQQPYAGPGYGAFFIPEKDDEVLVAFIHGDMRAAIILGGLYSGVDRPPSDRQSDAVKNEKLIRTKGGHQILLDDTELRTKVQITSQSGHTVELDDQQRTITIKTPGGQSVTLTDLDGSVTVTGTLSAAVTAGVDVSVTGGTTVTLTAGGLVTVAAPVVSLGPGSSPTVLGDALLTLFNSHTHPVAGASTTEPTQTMTGAQLSKRVTVT